MSVRPRAEHGINYHAIAAAAHSTTRTRHATHRSYEVRNRDVWPDRERNQEALDERSPEPKVHRRGVHPRRIELALRARTEAA